MRCGLSQHVCGSVTTAPEPPKTMGPTAVRTIHRLSGLAARWGRARATDGSENHRLRLAPSEPAPITGVCQVRMPAEPDMITGMHAVIYTRDPEADRNFFRDVLGF